MQRPPLSSPPTPVPHRPAGLHAPGRALPVGAEPAGALQAHFRVWAPDRKAVAVCVEKGDTFPLTPEGDGYFSAMLPVPTGALYRFRLDGDTTLYPDPASRFQPEGPHGPSQIIDPRGFAWTDFGWPGVNVGDCVIYEMHIGLFTLEGTWQAAIRELPRLAELGINVLEVMPVAEFPGRFGWGYDGVDLFAPTRLYGTPEDFRAFVNAAHGLGLAVILDVVYNHFGPDGNYMGQFSKAYFSQKHKTEWGEALNFDGERSAPVREFFVANARYWISEFHLDGLRLDATQSIFDDGDEHVLVAIGRAAREAAGQRPILLVAENEPQHARLARPTERGGYGLDMLWNDDFHHSAHVALTGHYEAYYSQTRGHVQELVSSAKYGFLYQGQYYGWQKKPRGEPAFDLEPWACVTFLDNHDQVANSGTGQRIHELTSPGRYRAMTALFLLMPGTPMLFMGQEMVSSAPFYYFADHNPDLAKLVAAGRTEFLEQFPSLKDPQCRPQLPAPHDPEAFAACKLEAPTTRRHRQALALHRDLIRMRRQDPTFGRTRRRGVDGAVLGPEAFVLRYFGQGPGEDRLLLVNLGLDLGCEPMPEPLLAPEPGHRWKLHWCSEAPEYGGGGVPSLTLERNWFLPGQSAFVLVPEPGEEKRKFGGPSCP